VDPDRAQILTDNLHVKFIKSYFDKQALSNKHMKGLP
jgi:hypothetical protein